MTHFFKKKLHSAPSNAVSPNGSYVRLKLLNDKDDKITSSSSESASSVQPEDFGCLKNKRF